MSTPVAVVSSVSRHSLSSPALRSGSGSRLYHKSTPFQTLALYTPNGTISYTNLHTCTNILIVHNNYITSSVFPLFLYYSLTFYHRFDSCHYSHLSLHSIVVLSHYLLHIIINLSSYCFLNRYLLYSAF